MNPKAFWQKRARREALRFNFAWWLQSYLPWLMGVSLACAAGVIALRSTQTGLHAAAWILPAILAAGIPVAFFRSRSKFLSSAEALVRLEADLGLNNRLTAAASGIADWPDIQPKAQFALRWDWKAALWPPLAALAMLVVSFYLPVSRPPAAAIEPSAEPPAWTSVQEKLNSLRQEALAQPEVINSLQAALDALRKQPSSQWFQQTSLEAGDHLRQRLDQGLAELQKNLERALGALEAARQLENTEMENLSEPLEAMFQEAVRQLESGALPLSSEELATLQKLDLSQIRQLSPAQWQELTNRIQASAGEGQNPGAARAAVLAALKGQGGNDPSRGRNDAPLSMKDNESRLGTTRTESLPEADLSRSALGDIKGLESGAHEVDESAWQGPQEGGTLAAPGSGGDAVWEQTATPDEQAALKRFFR